MLFSSLEFLFLFLPITLIVYFIVPLSWRNIVLLFFSLIFYGWGEPIYLFLMIFTIVVDYLAGYLIGRFEGNRPRQKTVLVWSIIINLALLGFFKYFDFLLISISDIIGIKTVAPLGISLPIGISFYTFQSLSYVIDIYRKDASVQKSIIKFGTYVTLFPQLIAGPIVRYRDIDEQLSERDHSIELAADGLRRFICGLCKKILIANTAGVLWENAKNILPEQQTVLGAWFGIICFSIQIYFDFSGYSDMAIGLGKIFGFDFLENFNYPYISKSITDFWRRWHISLSSWFREYVYIPLGGNRCSKQKMYLNLLTVWFLTGLWHGASWNYIIWGLYYFVLLFIEKAFLIKRLEKAPRIVTTLYSLFFIAIGWLIFAFEDSSAGMIYVKNMIGIGGSGFASGVDIYELFRNAVFLCIAALAATPIPKQKFKALCERSHFSLPIANILCVVMLLLCTAYLVDSSFNPFLYFRF